MQRFLLIYLLLAVGAVKFPLSKSYAEVDWESVDTPNTKPSSVVWKKISEPSKSENPNLNWEVVPEYEGQKSPSSRVDWEVLEAEDKVLITPLQMKAN